MGVTDVTKVLRETVGDIPRRSEWKPGDPVQLGGAVALVASGIPERAHALLGSLMVHALRDRDGTWRLSATLAAAIEAEVAERVAEALQAQLPDDAPENPKAWQGRGRPGLREVWSPKEMRWSEAEAAAVVHARDRMRMLSDALRALCIEPPELDMPMRARRGWRQLELMAHYITDSPAEEMCLKARAAELRLLLRDSGEPL